MPRPQRRKPGGRRPRKAGDERRRDFEELSPEERKERQEQRFLEDIEKRIKYFLISEEPELDLEPMNSYKRRLVHKVAVQFNLDTESRGEEPERWVCLIRTDEAKVPQGRARPRLVDYGTQTFPVNPGPDGIHMALKMDGSIELWREDDQRSVVHDRVVKSRQIRIRNGRIVTPDDPEW